MKKSYAIFSTFKEMDYLAEISRINEDREPIETEVEAERLVKDIFDTATFAQKKNLTLVILPIYTKE